MYIFRPWINYQPFNLLHVLLHSPKPAWKFCIFLCRFIYGFCKLVSISMIYLKGNMWQYPIGLEVGILVWENCIVIVEVNLQIFHIPNLFRWLPKQYLHFQNLSGSFTFIVLLAHQCNILDMKFTCTYVAVSK